MRTTSLNLVGNRTKWRFNSFIFVNVSNISLNLGLLSLNYVQFYIIDSKMRIIQWIFILHHWTLHLQLKHGTKSFTKYVFSFRFVARILSISFVHPCLLTECYSSHPFIFLYPVYSCQSYTFRPFTHQLSVKRVIQLRVNLIFNLLALSIATMASILSAYLCLKKRNNDLNVIHSNQ